MLGVAINGDVRAYPVKVLNFHEIVNHVVGGEKISVTYCPLTASGINFSAAAIEFGNTGGLFNNNMVMCDRETGSFWSHMRVSSIMGSRVGERLEMRPVFQGIWEAWRALYPDTQVLSKITGYRGRNYDQDIYEAYEYTTSEEIWFPNSVPIDGRFHSKDMVLGLVGERATKGYVLGRLEGRTVINDVFEGDEIVVLFQRSARVGMVFSREVEGRVLTFELVR